jgi:hypothetical protein
MVGANLRVRPFVRPWADTQVCAYSPNSAATQPKPTASSVARRGAPVSTSQPASSK